MCGKRRGWARWSQTHRTIHAPRLPSRHQDHPCITLRGMSAVYESHTCQQWRAWSTLVHDPYDSDRFALEHLPISQKELIYTFTILKPKNTLFRNGRQFLSECTQLWLILVNPYRYLMYVVLVPHNLENL